MRNLTLALVLASAIAAASPAVAQDADREGWTRRAERGEPRERAVRDATGLDVQMSRRAPQQPASDVAQASPQRSRQDWGGGEWQGRNRGQAPVAVPQAQAQPQAPRGNWDGNRSWQGRRNGDGVANVPRPVPQPRADSGSRDANGNGRGWNRGENEARRDDGRWQGRQGNEGWRGRPPVVQPDVRRDGRDWNDDRRRADGGDNRGWRRGDDGRWGRHADNQGHDDRRWNGNDGRNHDNWNRSWRNDRRYDWKGYRNQYRDRFRAPRYYNPYGWNYGYQRFGSGIYLESLFYGRNYWISDPWTYRLPTAPYGYRWVRYFDDVLLVDVRSGYVVDVIHDFFW